MVLFALAAAAATAAPLPPALAPYVHDGKLDPGDWGWMRGAFTDAGPAQKAVWTAVRDWLSRCAAADRSTNLAELATLGIAIPPAPDTGPLRTLVCAQAGFQPEGASAQDWPSFVRDAAVVRPIARAYLSAVAIAEEVARPDDDADLAQQISSRAVGEQMLRFGFSWAGGARPDSPALTAPQRAILASEISMATEVRDRANTVWLKGIVARGGWPKRSQVGGPAADTAWLLVQHADAEPAFQLRALRLMEPLVATGDVDRKNYAYLYDRVMLRIAGHQRYATQMTCKGGYYSPLPLENATAVDARRREAGMQSLADYEKQMIEVAGPCPPDRPAAGP